MRNLFFLLIFIAFFLSHPLSLFLFLPFPFYGFQMKCLVFSKIEWIKDRFNEDMKDKGEPLWVERKVKLSNTDFLSVLWTRWRWLCKAEVQETKLQNRCRHPQGQRVRWSRNWPLSHLLWRHCGWLHSPRKRSAEPRREACHLWPCTWGSRSPETGSQRLARYLISLEVWRVDLK